MTLLLLAGTGEAQHIAQGLAAQGVRTIASLAGGARAPKPLPVPTRVGGFGGEAAFRRFLREEDISAVLDATHPFAHRISLRTSRVCGDLSIPYCQYLRPPWRAQEGDAWHEIDSEEALAGLVQPGQTVFLATGRQTLERFANLTHARVICRQIDPPEGPFPFPGGSYLVGRPPFSVADEEALFRDLGVDWLVVKNAGGDASQTKLVAARNLGLPVAMISRPPQPEAPRVETVQEALAWVAAL